MRDAVKFAETFIIPGVSTCSLIVRSCVCWMHELTMIDNRFSFYFTGIALLHVACKKSRNGFNGELIDVLSKVLGSNLSSCCNVFSFAYN